MSEEPRPNWALWPAGFEVASVLTTSDLWGVRVGELLIPSSGVKRWVAAEQLRPIGERSWSGDEAMWRAAAGRAIYAMAHGRPLALSQARLEPLPHQIGVLRRAMELDHIRLLLADEVGLGKTIEAGLIAKELTLRDRVKRVLVVAPKGVQLQWVAEMRHRFGEEFARVGPGAIPVDAGINPWRAFDRIVCSLDAVKPVRRRAGWSLDRLEAYNRERFQAVLEAGWDLVIIDEAHHVAGSTDEIARHELARELAASTDHMLLLSATPHSGKTESFQRLLGLIDPGFTDGKPLDRDNVVAVVVRNEKRSAVDADGRPLFQPRTTELRVAPYGDRTVERALYSALTEYVRDGYKRALKDRRPAVGFLMLLMQRLVSSSTAAIQTALEKRLAALTTDGGQLALFAEGAERWAELTGEEQYEALASAQGAASGGERKEVEILLDLARKAAAAGVDAKATYLLDLLRECQRHEGDPSLKFVVFTEFIPTQDMLLDLLERAGISATSINGSLSIDERALAQETFERDCQVLVSTDAGGEGINLQFSHVVINYDLPWNPMRIEQRIGRVDRIGQRHPVRAFNLVMENSVDAYVLQVLDEKLWRILDELGSDKWGDVLESAGRSVENLYAGALAQPNEVEKEAASLAERTRGDVAASDPIRDMLRSDAGSRGTESLEDPGRWLELARQAWQRFRGQSPPNGVRILDRLPHAVTGEPLPLLRGFEAGVWSLWEVRPDGNGPVRDCFAVFSGERAGSRPDLAETIWLKLAEGAEVEAVGPPTEEEWEAVCKAGIDFGYGPCRDLAPPEQWNAPWLVPRLVVRVQP